MESYDCEDFKCWDKLTLKYFGTSNSNTTFTSETQQSKKKQMYIKNKSNGAKTEETWISSFLPLDSILD